MSSSSPHPRCARRGYPGLYTDVHHYMASGWLTEVLRDAETCPPPPEAKEDIVNVKEKTTTPITVTSTTPELSENDATSYRDVLLIIGGSGYSFGRKVCFINPYHWRQFKRTRQVELWSTNQVCSIVLADLPNLRTNLDAATLDGQPIICGGDHTPYSCMKMNPDYTWSQFIFTKGVYFLLSIQKTKNLIAFSRYNRHFTFSQKKSPFYGLLRPRSPDIWGSPE